MSSTRVGATKKFADNWESIFGGGKSRSSAMKKSIVQPARKSAKRKLAKKKAAKKSPPRGKKKGR